MGKTVDVLLARKRQLEAEQSGLWARIAMEAIGDRDIPMQPLYHYRLHVVGAKAGDDRLGTVRAAVLFLRKIDRVADDTKQSLDTDQAAAFRRLRDDVHNTQREMQGKIMAEADSNSLQDINHLSKRLSALGENITDSYRLALDGEAVGDEPRQRTFRGKLQESLPSFAETTLLLDQSVVKLAGEWQIQGEAGHESLDSLAVSETREGGEKQSGNRNVATNAPQPEQIRAGVDQTAKSGVAAEGRIVNLMPLIDPERDTVGRKWNLKDGVLTAQGGGKIEILYRAPQEYDLRVQFSRVRGNGFIGQILAVGEAAFTWSVGQDANQNFMLEAEGHTQQWKMGSPLNRGQRYTSLVQVRKNGVKGYLDGTLAAEWKTDYHGLTLHRGWEIRTPGVLGLNVHNATEFQTIEVIEVTGRGGVVAAPHAGEKQSSNPNLAANAPQPQKAPGVAEADQSPKAEAPPAGHIVNLMPLIDPERDILKGKWSLKDGSVICDSPGRIEIRYPPQEYDFHIEFTRRNGDSLVGQTLSVGENSFEWFMGEAGNKNFMICTTGPSPRWPMTPGLKNGRRYAAVVQVRKDGVKALLDGTPVAEWATDYRGLKLRKDAKLKSPGGLGLAASDAEFEVVEILEVTGRGGVVATQDVDGSSPKAAR